jgi:SagB-type dehydrogenase family enzyme
MDTSTTEQCAGTALVEPFILPLGFAAPELEEIEVFHETTKLKSFHEKLLGRRIGVYLTDKRAIEETAANYKVYSEAEKLRLPPPAPIEQSFTEILANRTSCRSFSGETLTLAQVSQILSAVRANRVGQTGAEGINIWFRPFPSGGGLYPTEVYVAARNIEGLANGIYHYDGRAHELSCVASSVPFSSLAAAMSDEDGLTLGAGLIIFVSVLLERTVVKYSYRGYRFAMMEAGMVPLMINLAATGIGLDCLHWGGFLDDKVNGLIGLNGFSESVVSSLIIGSKSA